VPKIILVSLVYNRKNLVGLAVQSAINQTLDKSKWVHVIIDNASTDGADRVCKVFDKKYSHIHYVKMASNLGQMPAYNWVLNNWIPNNVPDAEIMVHLDSDDMLMSNALVEIENKFRSNSLIGQIYSDFNIININGKIKHKRHPKAKQVDPRIELTEDGQKILRIWEIKFNVIGHIRAMRIEALRSIGGFDECYKYATDVNMACKMLTSSYMVAKIPKILYLWREHGKDQVQGEKSIEQTRCWNEICSKYRELWKESSLI